MAILEINYKSACLRRFVKVRAVLPFENSDFTYDKKDKRYQTLYLLHGYTGNQDDWITESPIVREARHRKIAVVMAAADNSFYHNHPEFDSQYAGFIGQELVDVTRQIFPLSDKREDTFIAGNSMGGYGALYVGSRYCLTFSRIAVFSGGFVHHLSEAGLTPDVNMKKGQEEYLRNLFARIRPEETLESVLKAMAQSSHREEIYMTCGKDDPLAGVNRTMFRYLQGLDLPAAYREIPGSHDWDTWSRMLPDALDWMKGV